ncbi:hypothetical protein FACS18949_07310 [Clostridia bacterium]|nr:hypothetical protein FACS18949_07310 [Clostridia bacterium]
MNDFYIKKLIVTGKDKTPSTVEFGTGLNIVCGPSDTGKSYIIECIDYIFGGSNVPIDENVGYDCVKMIVETEFGAITAERVFETNKLQVSSTDPRIESGSYGTRTGKLNANTDLWLKLIGIEERHTVVSNKDFVKKNLTWRFFLHMFLIQEERVIGRPSILLPRQNTAQTGTLSSLLYLITGKDFAETDPREEKKIRAAKKAAVASYITNRLSNFAERKVELDGMSFERIDLAAQVEEIIDEIARTEAQITDVTRHNKGLLREIFSLNERLTECNTLLSRYQRLKSQYHSDVRRLSLIAVGDYHGEKYPVSAKCPFCDSDIQVADDASYIEPAHGELHQIQAQMRDLAVSDEDLTTEREEIESRIDKLTAEKREVESLLNNELKPKAASLKQTLAEYRKAMEVQDEYRFISGLETSMKGELFEAQMEEEDSDLEFNVKSRFDREIMDVFDQYVYDVLRQCHYDGLGSARLGHGKFDVLVNEKDKSKFGKGYRAFLNTVLALALLAFLDDKGKYSPRLLLVDSPILTLKEKKIDNEASDTMKAALFRYMRDHQENGQMIIIENDIPDMDYGSANIISFTKDETEGRYGFLSDVR